jgi:hypothetical protein
VLHQYLSRGRGTCGVDARYFMPQCGSFGVAKLPQNLENNCHRKKQETFPPFNLVYFYLLLVYSQPFDPTWNMQIFLFQSCDFGFLCPVPGPKKRDVNFVIQTKIQGEGKVQNII